MVYNYFYIYNIYLYSCSVQESKSVESVYSLSDLTEFLYCYILDQFNEVKLVRFFLSFSLAITHSLSFTLPLLLSVSLLLHRNQLLT